jgi:TRAP-type C4-dicarboxylate transport system permease large subunit
MDGYGYTNQSIAGLILYHILYGDIVRIAGRLTRLTQLARALTGSHREIKSVLTHPTVTTSTAATAIVFSAAAATVATAAETAVGYAEPYLSDVIVLRNLRALCLCLLLH